eukprot:TRINITY_DN980_c0_g1_i2.p1 TRINITY_DN980_c0_g1~~TRINITY_DN980_c0_g1_i2.p1  ORF type:complete len:715 (-),score=246.38 TRINITY_DN980_c0_g1_i2:307-2451(-)
MLSWDDITLKPVINTLEEGIDEETALKIFHDNLGVILKYSPFKTEEEIHKNIEKIKSSTGTSGRGKAKEANNEPPPELYSLYAFLSTLYLNPKMNMYIKGHKVRAKKFILALYKPRAYSYKPSASAPINITYGFNKQSKQHFGMMIYHKNRLIKSYIRVGYQLNPDSRGVGVIGVCEASFLQPTHNKQDFVCDNNYRLLINALKDRLTMYWSDCEIGSNKGLSISELWIKLANAASKGPWWIQCDNVRCLKWRKINKDPSELPENWVCSMNKDSEFDDCSVVEEEYNIDTGKRTRAAGSELRKKLESQISQDEERYKHRMERKKQKLRAVKSQELSKATGFSVELCEKALTKKNDDREASFKWLVKNGKENGEKGDKEKLRKVWREIKEERRKKQLKETQSQDEKSKKKGKKRKRGETSSEEEEEASDSKSKKKNKKEKDKKKSKKNKKQDSESEEEASKSSDSDVMLYTEQSEGEERKGKHKAKKGKEGGDPSSPILVADAASGEHKSDKKAAVVKLEKLSDDVAVIAAPPASSTSTSTSTSTSPLVSAPCDSCPLVKKKLHQLHNLFELPWEFSENLNDFDEKRVFEDIKLRFVHEQEVLEAKINIYEDYLREIGVDPSSLYASEETDADNNQPPQDNEDGGMLESEAENNQDDEGLSTISSPPPSEVSALLQSDGESFVAEKRDKVKDKDKVEVKGEAVMESEGETEGEVD